MRKRITSILLAALMLLSLLPVPAWAAEVTQDEAVTATEGQPSPQSDAIAVTSVPENKYLGCGEEGDIIPANCYVDDDGVYYVTDASGSLRIDAGNGVMTARKAVMFTSESTEKAEVVSASHIPLLVNENIEYSSPDTGNKVVKNVNEYRCMLCGKTFYGSSSDYSSSATAVGYNYVYANNLVEQGYVAIPANAKLADVLYLWTDDSASTGGSSGSASVGDVNGTDGIDITDVNCLYAYLITGEQGGSLSEEQFQAAADLNKDDQIDIYDLQILYEVASGLLNINDLPGNDKNKVKIGIITYLDENSNTDLYFINAIKDAIANLRLSESDYIVKTQVSQYQVYDTAVTLVDAGCNIIFANNFWYEPYLIQAAKEFPDVQFCHASGTRAHTEGLSNYHNAFASIYESRYLTGIAAGMKLNEMIAAGEFTAAEAKMGFVGSFTYPEIISAYTAFFLGARSVCPSVTMDVTFSGEWYNEAEEQKCAQKLIDLGCKLISHHTDSLAVPVACEKAGIPNIPHNISMGNVFKNTYIISSRINWTPYMEYAIRCVQNGTAIATDWTGTLSTGSVVMNELNTAVAAAGTAEAINAAAAKLKSGELYVFGCSTFTVNGETLTSYLADVIDDGTYTPDTEVIIDGHFVESTFRSAPYFDIYIDGIELLDAAF